MTDTPKVLPVGSRPRCLHCKRELRPNYRRPEIPWNWHAEGIDLKQWRKEHPAVFKGTYGGYADNTFCGLNCGYQWARDYTRMRGRDNLNG